MSTYGKQSHVVWKCDYHIVWTPNYRFRVLSGLVKDLVEHAIRMLSEWKGCEVMELNVQSDHVHLVISIPPNVLVSELMGTLKGKVAIKLFRSYPQLKKKPNRGNHFWARGYFVNTVGINEDHIRRYVNYQESEDRKEENQSEGFTYLSCLMSSLRAMPATFYQIHLLCR